MIKSATSEIQKFIIEKLNNDKNMSDLIDNRIFDRVPENAVFPYVSIGTSDATSEMCDCITIEEITFQLDVWSRAVGSIEMREIARAVKVALHDQDLSLENNAGISFRHVMSREFRDPDGITSHAALTFEAIVQV